MRTAPCQQAILDYLEGEDWVSPTEIGMAVGNKSYVSASAWVFQKAEALIKKGLIERNERGKLRKKRESPAREQ